MPTPHSTNRFQGSTCYKPPLTPCAANSVAHHCKDSRYLIDFLQNEAQPLCPSGEQIHEYSQMLQTTYSTFLPDLSLRIYVHTLGQLHERIRLRNGSWT